MFKVQGDLVAPEDGKALYDYIPCISVWLKVLVFKRAMHTVPVLVPEKKGA